MKLGESGVRMTEGDGEARLQESGMMRDQVESLDDEV